MKKLFIVLAVASLGFVACNNDSEKKDGADTTVVAPDTTVVVPAPDTTVVVPADTTVKVDSPAVKK